MPQTTPACPQCGLENTYPDATSYICPDCAFEWPMQAEEESGEAAWQVHDARGERTFHQRRQFLHRLFVEFEVDAGRAIGQI